MEKTLVVMAAGMGSRYGGLKQVDGFGPSNETLLEYSLFDALRAGFQRVVFVVRRDMVELFKANVVSRFAHRVPHAFVYQELDALPSPFTPPPGRQRPWGTGHAVLMARPEVKGPFAVINADDYYGPGAFRALVEFLDRPQTGPVPVFSLVGYRIDRTLSEHGAVARGVCQVDAGMGLLSVTEHPKIEQRPDGIFSVGDPQNPTRLDPATYVSLNTWGFTPALFDMLAPRFEAFLKRNSADAKAEFYLPAAVDAALRAGEAKAVVLPTDEQWFGVTYREDRPRVQEQIRLRLEGGQYPRALWA